MFYFFIVNTILHDVYWGQAYSVSVDSDGDGTNDVFTYILNKDGSGAIYQNGILQDSLPASSAAFDGYNIIDVESGNVVGVVSIDGTQLNIIETILTLDSDFEVPIAEQIPEGGTYYVGVTSTAVGDYTGATATYTAGDNFPVIVNDGDVYVYGDYEYRYNQIWFAEWVDIGSDNEHLAERNGWSVRVLDNTKSSYGEILSIINHKDVKNLFYTFADCENMTVAPEIPDTVVTLSNTFICTALEDLSDFTIPDSVETMLGTFEDCTNLINASMNISKNVSNMFMTFNGCTALEVAPNLSNCTKLTKLEGTFRECTNLKTYGGSTDADGDFFNYVIPDGVTDMSSAFNSCASLRIAPAIPKNVTSIVAAFDCCSALTTAPIIPDSVTDMNTAFRLCTALIGTIEINANPTSYTACFKNIDFSTQNITLTGTSTLLDELGTTGIGYCADCNGKCLNNH